MSSSLGVSLKITLDGGGSGSRGSGGSWGWPFPGSWGSFQMRDGSYVNKAMACENKKEGDECYYNLDGQEWGYCHKFTLKPLHCSNIGIPPVGG